MLVLVALPVALFLSGCIGGSWPPPSGGSLPAQGPVAFETIADAPGLGGGDFNVVQIRVIQDPEAWADYWPDSLPYPRPAIDFEREMVIAVAEGYYTGGYHLTLDQIVVDGLTLRVDTTTTVPGANCGVTLALSAAWHVVKLHRLGLPVQLTNQQVTHWC